MAGNKVSEADKIMECPICYDTMSVPIIQCEQGGHAMCQNCITANSVKICPICRGPLKGRRALMLEQLISSIKDDLHVPCYFSNRGCKFKLKMSDKDQHEAECRHRKFKCEGKTFAGWNCNWTGDYADLMDHFKKSHANNIHMQYNTNAALKIAFDTPHKDIQLISFFNGQSYFYYKHIVDVDHQNLYWAIQYIGLRSRASNYYYEFEVFKGPTRKFKVTEICTNDVVKAEDVFAAGKCVVMPFSTAKSYLTEEGELRFKFRIMSAHKKPA